MATAAKASQQKDDKRKARERVRLKEAGEEAFAAYYRAEIPERRGKRVISMMVLKPTEGEKHYSLFIGPVFYQNNDGTTGRFRNLRSKELVHLGIREGVDSKTVVEDWVNDYYNHRLWLLRALRT